MPDSTPPNTPKPATGVGSLTQREGEMLAKAWSCLKSGPPEIDYPKLAAEMGMQNHRSAMNAWGAIKKKMQWATGDAPGGTASASKATGATASGKRKKPAAPTKNKSADSDDDDAAENDEATPSKKAKTTGRGKAGAAPKTPAKKLAAGRKTKTLAKVVKEETSNTEMKGTESDKEGSGDGGEVVKAEAGVDNVSGDEAGKESVKTEAAEDEAMDAV